MNTIAKSGYNSSNSIKINNDVDSTGITLFYFIYLTINIFKILNIFYFSEIQSEKIFGISRYGDKKLSIYR